jgi:type I restriction enzyme, S subunit
MATGAYCRRGDKGVSELPQGWASVVLDDVTSGIVGGGTPSKANQSYFEGEIPFMTVKDMNLRFPSDTQDKITKEALADSSARMIPAGTNIIATRMGLGKAVRPSIDVAINQDLKAIFPSQALDADFLHWKLIQSAPYFVGLGTGTTVKGVRLEDVRALPISLPPLPEQQRIVAKVDGLTARTARARKELNRIPTLIARYKQRLLALAFSGQLTAGWRAAKGLNDAKEVTLSEVAKSFSYGRCASAPHGQHSGWQIGLDKPRLHV